MSRTIRLDTEKETMALARAILKNLHLGDVILLEGPVGVGKSALARAIIQSQMAIDGHVEDVPSPTFTLIQTYETSRGPICHADLYRLSDPSELEELGVPDLFDTSIALIEWPDRLGRLRPDRHLKIALSFPDSSDSRDATLLPFGGDWGWIEHV